MTKEEILSLFYVDTALTPHSDYEAAGYLAEHLAAIYPASSSPEFENLLDIGARLIRRYQEAQWSRETDVDPWLDGVVAQQADPANRSATWDRRTGEEGAASPAFRWLSGSKLESRREASNEVGTPTCIAPPHDIGANIRQELRRISNVIGFSFAWREDGSVLPDSSLNPMPRQSRDFHHQVCITKTRQAVNDSRERIKRLEQKGWH